MHCGYVVEVKELRKHSNADRLQVATFFGSDTIVDLNVKVGDIGVYFPVDLQLSEEFCEQNNLVRKKDENGNNIGGFLEPDKRNIKAINLRGEKSDGLYMPLKSFDYCFISDEDRDNPFIDITEGIAYNHMKVGDQVTMLNGHEICKKYIPRKQYKQGGYSSGNKTRKHKVAYAPLFAEHADTEQLAYNLGAFKAGDEIEITLKMHGTSQRTGYLPVLKGYKKTLWEKITRKEGTPIYEYDYVSGTRRVVMEDFEGGNSFYGSNAFREQHHNTFVGKLNKGETVYYEVVGFTDTGAPIMATGNNDKVGKDFVKQYGKETVFSYGCTASGYPANDDGPKDPANQSSLYVYRMTMTNEDGFVVEYTPDFMRYRCEQMGVKSVPVFTKFILHDYDLEIDERAPGEIVKDIAERYYSGPDPVGKKHTREGVVVRILNRPKFAAFKHKCWEFKLLEGLIKDTAEAPDMEEAQEVE